MKKKEAISCSTKEDCVAFTIDQYTFEIMPDVMEGLIKIVKSVEEEDTPLIETCRMVINRALIRGLNSMFIDIESFLEEEKKS